MKIEYFDTLAAVLEAGSLAAAAVTMNLTPSAVSIQMKQLEAYFGHPLFDRSGHQVVATPFAREVLGCVRQTLTDLSALRQRESMAVVGAIRLGLIETVQVQLLPPTLRYMQDHFPHLRLKPMRGRTMELIEDVKSGALDAAVVAQPEDGGSSRLCWKTLHTQKLVLIAPPGARDRRPAALFKRYDWIRFDRNTTSGKLSTRYVGRVAPDARGSIELQSSHAVVSMVSAGLGVSVILLPDLRICYGYPVEIIKLGASAGSVRISLVCRNADKGSRNLDALFRALQAAAAKTMTG